MAYKIPLAAPDLSGKEEEYVVDAIRSTWISSTGNYIEQFEQAFAQRCQTSAAIGVCNGTVALHLALLALDVRPGDEVLVPSLTFVSTANAVRYVGAEPVFVDVDPETWCIDPQVMEDNISRRTRGIIAVHLYGHPADMDAINHIAGIHGLWVIEDAAEAHFAEYKGRPAGSLSSLATFSFYGNKIITSGEGGALTTSDPALELRIRTLRGQGMDPLRRYYFPVTGYNFRLTNLACAILSAQLERVDEMLGRRQDIFGFYREGLNGIPGIGYQPVADWADPAPWVFCITVDEDTYGSNRDQLMLALEQQGIETRPFFIGLNSLPPFREEASLRGDRLPEADRLSRVGMNLPTFVAIKDEDISTICGIIRQLHRTS